jgi:hypothetical protein
MKAAIVIIAFISVILLTSVLSAELDREEIEYGINTIIDEINSNQQYLDFIAHSRYHSVRLIADDEVFFIAYEDGALAMAEPQKKADLKIKMTEKDINKAIDSYTEGDFSGFKKLALKKLSFWAKLNLFSQCMRTSWCRKAVF